MTLVLESRKILKSVSEDNSLFTELLLGFTHRFLILLGSNTRVEKKVKVIDFLLDHFKLLGRLVQRCNLILQDFHLFLNILDDSESDVFIKEKSSAVVGASREHVYRVCWLKLDAVERFGFLVL